MRTTAFNETNYCGSFEDWCSEMSEQYPQFHFWQSVIDLELLLCQFVKSLRSGNFDLYVEAIKKMMPWVFALDHGNYARWMPVHLRDMLNLKSIHPNIYREFAAGHFTAQITHRKFSSIALDQSHEQMNKEIKGDGGSIGLFENRDSLNKWMVAGPQLAQVVKDFENNFLEEGVEVNHHEQGSKRQKEFLKHVSSLVDTYTTMGNPFIDTGPDLYTIDSKVVATEVVKNSVKNAKAAGENKFKMFWDERILGDKPITERICKTNIALFRSCSEKNQLKTKSQTKRLKKDCELFSKLYIGCQNRNGDLSDFFKHENHSQPPSLSNAAGKILSGNKSDLLPCLESKCVAITKEDQNKPTAKIIDGAMIVNMIKPTKSKTFEDYAKFEFLPYIRYDSI